MTETNGETKVSGSARHDPFAGLPDVLTLEEVETITRIPKQTLYRLIDAGVLPAWRLGQRNTRVWRDELREAIEAGRLTGGSHGETGDDQPGQ